MITINFNDDYGHHHYCSLFWKDFYTISYRFCCSDRSSFQVQQILKLLHLFIINRTSMDVGRICSVLFKYHQNNWSFGEQAKIFHTKCSGKWIAMLLICTDFFIYWSGPERIMNLKTIKIWLLTNHIKDWWPGTNS